MTLTQILFLVYWISILVSYSVFLPAIFEKAGQNKTAGYIPFYNLFVWLKVIKQPWWWIFLFIFPGINMVMCVVLQVDLVRKFGFQDFRSIFLAIFIPQFTLYKLANTDQVVYNPTEMDWNNKDLIAAREKSDHLILFLSLPFAGHALVYAFKILGTKDKPGKKTLVKEWSDAFIFAIVAAAIIRSYFFEAFTIPTGSMEKDLRIGDFLFVNKTAYGVRIPQTPLGVPFFHNVIMGTTIPSYSELIEIPYTRIGGRPDVERNDIMVFNFPASDTIIVEPELMTHTYDQIIRNHALKLWFQDGANGTFSGKTRMDYISKAKNFYKEQYGFRTLPVDKQVNYIKRCVAIPGDTLEIKNTDIIISGTPEPKPINSQLNYLVTVNAPFTNPKILKEKYEIYTDEFMNNFYLLELDFSNKKGVRDFLLFISKNNVPMQLALNDGNKYYFKAGSNQIISSSLSSSFESKYGYPLSQAITNLGNYKASLCYELPLTAKAKEGVRGFDNVLDVIALNKEKGFPYLAQYQDYPIFPNYPGFNWTADNFGPLYIPKAGSKIELTKENAIIYRRVIQAYEHHKMEIKQEGVYIDGALAKEYTFKYNYYWLMGDNRHNSADSRMWGFVPEPNVVGRASFVWLSIDKEDAFPDKIRWSRMFRFVD